MVRHTAERSSRDGINNRRFLLRFIMSNSSLRRSEVSSAVDFACSVLVTDGISEEGSKSPPFVCLSLCSSVCLYSSVWTLNGFNL